MEMNRVLLKLSGEALAGEKKQGFDEKTVYDVAGQVIKSVDVDGSARFTLDQQGCYIVKISDKTVKVVIR